MAPYVYDGRWGDMPGVDEREYKYIRYTPIVSDDPRDFGTDGYTLRMARYRRKIKLLVCITLYNEDFEVSDRGGGAGR